MIHLWWTVASYPGPLRRRSKGLVHTVCACIIFPVKAGNSYFWSAYLSVNVNLDLRNMPKIHFGRAKDTCCDQFSYQRANSIDRRTIKLWEGPLLTFIQVFWWIIKSIDTKAVVQRQQRDFFRSLKLKMDCLKSNESEESLPYDIL